MLAYEQALNILQRDPIRNANLINFMRDYPVTKLEVCGSSVLALGRSDRDWVYISSTDESEFRTLIAGLSENDTCFALMEDWMLPIVTGGRPVLWQMPCMKLFLPFETPVPAPDGPVYELMPEDAGYIFSHYDYAYQTNEMYLAERIEKGPALGIREDGRLIAWIMTHDDGAMGVLTVLPDYRRNGYGARVTLALIERLRRENRLPFVHIEESNEKSMGLSRKVGFVPDRRIWWVEVER